MKEKENRKGMPVFSGCLSYFPNALKEVSKVSKAGNDQHHPEKALHWDKSKSTDELDALTRHLIDHSVNPLDDDGQLHIAKVAWRSLAFLERYLEEGKGCSVGEKFVIDQSFYHTAMNREQLEEFAENVNERED